MEAPARGHQARLVPVMLRPVLRLSVLPSVVSAYATIRSEKELPSGSCSCADCQPHIRIASWNRSGKNRGRYVATGVLGGVTRSGFLFVFFVEHKETVKEVLGKDTELVERSMSQVVEQMAKQFNLDAEELQSVAENALKSLENMTPDDVKEKMDELMGSAGGLDSATMKMLQEMVSGTDLLKELNALELQTAGTEGTANNEEQEE